MTISVLFPGTGQKPAGGYKILYEYANRLVADGHNVNVIYASTIFTLKNICAGFIRYPYFKITKKYTSYSWFNLDKRIKCFYPWNLKEWRVPKSDVFIATAAETAYYLTKYKQNCKKIYFIQDFEAWRLAPEEVMETYRYPLTKIAIAPWLVNKIKEAGSDAVLIPNGFDFTYFKLTIPIEDRNKFSVAMLYHKGDRKRCIDSIHALDIVKKKYPELKISMFGVPDKPTDVPFNFEYYQMPDKDTHNSVYNNAAIFIAASKAEGMALPPAEAMQCGCALCCTDIGGFGLYAKNEETALLSPVFDYEKLANNIIRLIEDDELRIRLAKKGNKLINDFTWEKAYSAFKEVLNV